MVVVDLSDLPQMIIDPSDKRLFMLFKESADDGMNEEIFPELYDELEKQGKLIAFVHNHAVNKVYVSFPPKEYFNQVFNT